MSDGGRADGGAPSPADAVSDAAIDALVDAVESSETVDRDGLRASQSADGFRFLVSEATATGLTEAEFRDVARTHSVPVAEWYCWERRTPETPAGRAFLRWLERADERPAPARRRALCAGATRTWGQLQLSVTLDANGERTYDLRHRADADVPVRDLDEYDDPGAAVDLVRFDEDGRYRPLKTAPTLAGGWVFPDLGPSDLVRTVDAVYPATVANWHREREGALDVTHWQEAAARQTGIYDLVEELSGEQVDRLAEACCVDSQCLKRRQWDEDADEPLAVPRGEGAFPCREPCSLVVAAAREIALAERSEPERATVELSAAERDQLGRIVAAVAGGEADDVRDGDLDDGANRLRTRYLQAKLFDEESTLPIVGGGDRPADRDDPDSPP